MKKKEVRWISRDDYSSSDVEVWPFKPRKMSGTYVNPKTKCSDGRISRICELKPWINIKLAAGGLAKVTIERQY